MTNRPAIGILGGMGPEATVMLMSRLIAATPAQDDCDHLPLLVDMNPQVPSRIAYLIEGQGRDPGPVLADMARGLEGRGVAALVMPCNTAHHFASVIQDAVSVPLLNMVELAVLRAAEIVGPGGHVAVLGSPALQKVGVFDRALARRGLRAVYARDQEALLDTIRDLKRRGASAVARQTLKAASRDVAAQGAKVQLVACTEFSLIADALEAQGGVIDTLDVLVRAILDFKAGPRDAAAKWVAEPQIT